MFDPSIYAIGLAASLGLAVLGWMISVPIRDVSIVDSMWSMFFLLLGVLYLSLAEGIPGRALLVLPLLAIWAVRLSAHISTRNHGQGEDRRYREIRRQYGPEFRWRSLYLIFGLQALLAWIISLPLLAALLGERPLNAIDLLACLVWLFGFFFEAVGDYQLARFKARPENAHRVMDEGLWRYTRHPNYFGEACLWWGFYLFAVAAGGWWSFPAPILLTYLLLRVSGVALLERDIHQRRPGYREYIARTNAFFPGPPRKPDG